MRLLQITDLHLGKPHELPYDIDVRGNFLRLLPALEERKADLLVISGDLCLDTGELETYEWLKKQLHDISTPVAMIPGNHDDRQLMAQVFGHHHLLVDGYYCYARQDGPMPMLFLDTQDYALPAVSLDWLSAQLAQIQGPVVVFIHHPPALMEVPFMDQKYPLRNHAEVLACLHGHGHPVTVFCGHYHVDKSLRSRNVDIHVTPSTFFQIDWRVEHIQPDVFRLGYREISIQSDAIITNVTYLP